MDESRFGLQTITRRRLTLTGVKPVALHQHAFENFYVSGVVAPRTGAAYFEAHRTCNSAAFQAFLDHFATEFPDRFHILLLDNARFHHAKALRIPATVALLFLPPYAPELNPIERLWLSLKSRLAWRLFPSSHALQEALAPLCEHLLPSSLQALTAFPYLRSTLSALSS